MSFVSTGLVKLAMRPRYRHKALWKRDPLGNGNILAIAPIPCMLSLVFLRSQVGRLGETCWRKQVCLWRTLHRLGFAMTARDDVVLAKAVQSASRGR